MPDHLHFLGKAREKSIAHCMQELKKSSSRLINQLENRAGHKVWLDEYHDEKIFDGRDYHEKVRYIHQNPVKKGLCQFADEFPFSSANPKFETDRDLVFWSGYERAI
jgi:REP element-mobilizing transposase RayT